MSKFVLYNTQEEYALALKHMVDVLGLKNRENIPDVAEYLPGYFRWSEDGEIYYGNEYTFRHSYRDVRREDIYLLKIKTVVEFEAQEPMPEVIEIHGVEWVLEDVVKAIQQADLTPWNEPKGYADGLPC